MSWFTKIMSKKDKIEYLKEQEEITKRNAMIFYEKHNPKTEEEIIKLMTEFGMEIIKDLSDIKQ